MGHDQTDKVGCHCSVAFLFITDNKPNRFPNFYLFANNSSFLRILWYNKCTLDHPARKRHFFMEFVANESKKVEIETSTGVYQRHAIQTHFVQIGENYIDLIERYVKPLYEEGDLLSISEKVIALCQKRIVYRKDIHPGFWAKLLCRFVHVTPAGPGAGTPHKMQLIIMICGLPRVLLAAFCSAVTKLFGKKGVFYKVCGHEVDGIDGLIDYDISFKEYVDYGILNPENPSGVCDEIYEKTGVKAMIIDASDIDCVILGKCRDVTLTDDQLCEIVRDNPAGQEGQCTPFILIRKKA